MVHEHSAQVLIVFLICITLLRILYSKAKRLNETALDKEIINKVGYKVEDLELKVNILTYKMQYGTWPLPHQIHRSGFKKGLHNIRLTLSNPNDRNDWIKHVLLSPRSNDSCISYLKCNSASTHRLTELFDGRKKSMYPYFHRDNLLTERSSTKSSKTCSDRSLNSTCLESSNPKERKLSKSENLEVQHRSAAPLSILPRKRNTRSTSRMYKNPNFSATQKVPRPCEKLTETIDECKWYLQELHNSNKSLGLACSSSAISDESSIKDIWPETQPQGYFGSKNPADANEKFKEQNDTKETMKNINTEDEIESKETDAEPQDNENYVNVPNAVSPVLKLIDKGLLPSKLNITFCTEMLPQQSLTNVLIPPTFKLKKMVQTSEETLYQVKKKLESLYDVLKAYDSQNSEARTVERQNADSNNMHNICQNVVDTLVSISSEIENLNEKKRSKVSFDIDKRTNRKGMPRIAWNTSEQRESDETCRSSDVSIQSYSNVFNESHEATCNALHFSSISKCEPKVCVSSKHHKTEMIEDLDERIPERVYYTLSTDSLEEKNSEKKKFCTGNDQTKLFPFYDQNPVPMDTEEDLIILSPTSSHTEISKDSELDDKSTALLLQEALQFKKALLTRVELETTCSVCDGKSEDSRSESPSEHVEWPHVNNNLQSKLLDIITEEQSVSSSTEKTSRTCMFLNVKQEEHPLAHLSIINKNLGDSMGQVRNQNSVCKELSESKHVFDSPSEYFSFSNIIHESKGIGDNESCLPKRPRLHENTPLELMPNNLQVKYLNINSPDKISDGKLVETKSVEKVNESKNINEIICKKSEDIQNISPNQDTYEISNFPSFEPTKQSVIVSNIKDVEDILLNTKIYSADDLKYTKDSEILRSNPNLILKRHLGMCSLIEQTQSATNIEEGSKMHKMFGKTESTIESTSLSGSKGNSIETNLMQDSLTSDMNYSNDSNVLGQSSATALTEKLINEKEINSKWQDVDEDLNDNYIDDKENITFSANTITIHESDVIIKHEPICNENVTFVEECEITETPYNQKHQSKENCLEEGKGDAAEETDLRKSYSNLISPHSSLYFTDEASSSIAKLNNTPSENLGDQLNLNLEAQQATVENIDVKVQYETKDSKQYTGNIELQYITTSGEYKNINNNVDPTNIIKTGMKILDKNFPEATSDSNNNQNDNCSPTSSINYVHSKDALRIKEIEITPTKQNQVDLLSVSNHVNSYNKTISNNNDSMLPRETDLVYDKSIQNPLINKAESSVHRNTLLCNISSHQISPRNVKENIATKRMNTLKSKSQENYISKSEKKRKSNAVQSVKGIKADLSQTFQPKAESNINLPNMRVRDLSVEPRRSKEYSSNDVHKKRSRSQISFRTNQSSLQHTASLPCESPIGTNTANRNQSFESKLKLKVQSKSLIPTPKTSSRSCIPVLKSRLEAARRTEIETRPKSPMRGPLTVTMLWRDNLCKNRNVSEEMMQTEGTSKIGSQYVEVTNSCAYRINEENTDETNINKSIVSQERMVIYVNIFTKYDRNTTRIVDPNKFLEYVKNRELNVQNVLDENQSTTKDTRDENLLAIPTEKKESTIRKVVTIVSSVINGNDLNQNSVGNTYASNTNDVASADTLSSGKLKSVCFITVEQKEIDVTAKPSVIDTSTSISDLQDASGTSRTELSKFLICGTPKELNNEEYIALLEILNQEPNFVHLKELQNLCKKLTSEYENSK